MDWSLPLFILIGFIAQMCDGAIGMGFGLISNIVLTGMGVPTASVSATVNGAKMFTGAIASWAHVRQQNIDWSMLRLLGVGGVAGAILGCWLLIELPAPWLTPVINGYLIVVGVVILWRARHELSFRSTQPRVFSVGVAGGVLESLSGVWGPLVTSNMVAMGGTPRYVVGSVTVAETIVAVAVFVMLGKHIGIDDISKAVLGLLLGAMIAAPFAARLTRNLPKTVLMTLVGLLVLFVAGYRLFKFYAG